MSIFAKPDFNNEQEYKIVFLHGLEGSVNGRKAKYLKEKWGAFVPPLRTSKLIELKSTAENKSWENLDRKKKDDALEPAFRDAVDAINYIKPDMVIGSSMGGAILMKLVSEGYVNENTPCIFLAPAIKQLLGAKKLPNLNCSSWILAENDEIVPNGFNIRACVESGGNLSISPEDGHRLSLIVENGLLDSAIISCMEISNL